MPLLLQGKESPCKRYGGKQTRESTEITISTDSPPGFGQCEAEVATCTQISDFARKGLPPGGENVKEVIGSSQGRIDIARTRKVEPKSRIMVLGLKENMIEHRGKWMTST